MQIGNKLFPYPVISSSASNCFCNSKYSFESEDSSDGQHYILGNARIVVENDYLRKLLEEKKISAKLIVECTYTVYRESFDISTEPRDIKIDVGNLKDKVEISCYMYANEDIDNYSNEDFIEEYRDYKFNIEKNSVIGIDDGFSTIIEYNEELDKKVASIFMIIPVEDCESMRVESLTSKIVIKLPKSEFDHYSVLRNNSNFNNIIFSMLAIPALAQCLKEFQDKIILSEYELDDFEMDHRWMISIRKAYKKLYNTELTDEIFVNTDVFELAQKLLNNGTIKGIKDLFNIVMFSKHLYDGGDTDE